MSKRPRRADRKSAPVTDVESVDVDPPAQAAGLPAVRRTMVATAIDDTPIADRICRTCAHSVTPDNNAANRLYCMRSAHALGSDGALCDAMRRGGECGTDGIMWEAAGA